MTEEWRGRLQLMQGLIEVDQGERLAELAAGVPAETAIVEIGSHTGLSTCWMAHAATAHVFAVDPWGEPRPRKPGDDFDDDPFELGAGVYERFAHNIAAEGLWPRITPLAAPSLDVASLWRQPVGLLFIDALHTEPAVRADVAAWAPFLVTGGWLALHDYTADPEHAYHGVAVVADELGAPAWEVAPLVGSLWTARKA